MTKEEVRKALLSIAIGVLTSLLTLAIQWLTQFQGELIAPATGGAASVAAAWKHLTSNLA